MDCLDVGKIDILGIGVLAFKNGGIGRNLPFDLWIWLILAVSEEQSNRQCNPFNDAPSVAYRQFTL